MYALLLASEVIGAMYFGLRRRTFDALSVGFFSACIYFLPAHYGYVLYPASLATQRALILPETLLVMTMVTTAILIAATMKDRTSLRAAPPTTSLAHSSNNSASSSATYQLLFYGLLTGLGLLGTLLSSGSLVLHSSKEELMITLDRWYILWETTALFGWVLAFLTKRLGFAAFFGAALTFDLLLGFRVNFAIALISALYIHLSAKGNSRLFLSSWRICISVLIAGYSLFLFKGILWALRDNNFELMRRLLSNPGTYLDVVAHSEPFITQGILNAVLEYEFSVGPNHLSHVFSLILPYSTTLGTEPISFNALFQDALFPGLTFGMGNNIWAQMWSAGGWGLLILFVLVYSIFLSHFSLKLRSPNHLLNGVLISSAILWAFYVHRNDLIYQLTMQRRILAAGIACWALFQLSKSTVSRSLLSRRGDSGIPPFGRSASEGGKCTSLYKAK